MLYTGRQTGGGEATLQVEGPGKWPSSEFRPSDVPKV